ncbi:unnamed protein product [Polarella glacialis]|uniref:Uncharacterized protein n=1 Tax=Polarella glacialis TaxID=89957 RepID=A0A813GNL5_POLGL|nr:unnamed protein product [Polarella glacialis]
MALAVAQLLLALSDADCDVRRAAVQALAKGAAHADPAAVQLLVGRSQDSDEDVREAVLSGLASLAERGEPTAVSAALQGLQDEDPCVRRAAARAVGSLCTPADESAAISLAILLRDGDREDREAASDALAELAGADGRARNAVEAVLALLTDNSAEIRCRGTRALGRVAQRGDASALAAVLALVDDGDDAARCAAAHAVGLLGEQGDVTAAAVLSKRLVAATGESAVEVDGDVRSEILLALSRVAPLGDAACLMAVATCLADESEDVRSAAVDALETLDISDSRCSKLLATVQSQLEAATDAAVRCTGLRAFAVVARQGGAEAAAVCRRFFADGDEDVRRAAVEGLVAIGVDRGDSASLAGLLERLADSDEDVRSAAAAAIAQIALPGDGQAVAALTRALSDEDCDVRRVAVTSLATVAGSAVSRDTINAIAQCLQDEHETVRDSAAEALARLAHADPTTVVETVNKLYLRHECASTRWSAVRCLASSHRLGPVCCPDSIASLLEDSDELVRQEATDALASIVFLSCKAEEALTHFIDATLSRCAHSNHLVRAAALEAVCKMFCSLGDVSTSRDEQVCHILLQGLEDHSPEVRETVARSAAMLPLSKNAALSSHLRNCVAARLEGQSRSAQRAAVVAVAAAWPRGNASVVKAALLQLSHSILAMALAAAAGCLEDDDERVRSAAPRLQHSRASVRATAVDAVAAVVLRGDAAGEAALLAILGSSKVREPPSCDEEPHDDDDVRWSALRSLCQVAAHGSSATVAAAVQCTQDADEPIRIAAIRLLREVAEPGNSDVMSSLMWHVKRPGRY